MYRVLKDHVFVTSTGKRIPKTVNELVNVVRRMEEKELRSRGIIGPVDSYVPEVAAKALPQQTARMRVGIWLTTTKHYSGGRIHMYQIAWTLGRLGAEVFLITNGRPMWAADYPPAGRPNIVIDGHNPVPKDLDVVMTDSKGEMGRKALNYLKVHPRLPLVCMNFETPNWVKKFCPDYGAKLEAHKDIFEKADILLANSDESAKYLREWIGNDTPIHVVRPAVNTTSPSAALPPDVDASRPYAVWSARSAQYKNGKLAARVVAKLPAPFDLVMIGQPPRDFPRNSADHRFIPLNRIPDSQKYALLQNAAVVLAPSLFEGFGMVPAEALCSGTPVVAFDLPVLRQEYGDRIVYAKWNDEKDYIAKVRQAVKKPPRVDQTDARADYGIDSMVAEVEAVPYLSVKSKRVSVQLLTYWGFVPESIESVYPHVDEILVAHGRCPHAMEIDDGSWDRLQQWKSDNDVDDKIRIEKREMWKGGKREMRQWCVDNSSGNYMLMLDGDEIWAGLDAWIRTGLQYGCPRWVNFWHDLEHWVFDTAKLAGTRWGRRLDPHGSVCPHYRWSFWRRSYFFWKHPLPTDVEKKPIYDRHHSHAEFCPEAIIYHLGHCLPEPIMEAKHQFYLDRDGDDPGRRMRRDAWREWAGDTGDCGDGVVERVGWDIPDIVRRAYTGMQSCVCV